MNFNEKNIQIVPPKTFKKITGTRFASILGVDRWNSPFKTWCAITRTYEEPFVDSIYTLAGKTIEPLVAKYLNDKVFLGDLITADQHYGGDAFKATWGDFFTKTPIYGGMWDAIIVEDGEITGVVEIKTTKRAEDWSNGAPINYALQGALYAYLLGVDQVHMVCSFLEDKDYEHPEQFKPDYTNTIIDSFLISERFPDFQAHIDRATQFWNDHVLTGISPEFDPTKDGEILKALRTNNVDNNDDIRLLIQRADELTALIAEVSPLEKELTKVKEAIKAKLLAEFRDNDTKVEVATESSTWTLSKSTTQSIDKAKLEADGLLHKYAKESTTYTLRRK